MHYYLNGRLSIAFCCVSPQWDFVITNIFKWDNHLTHVGRLDMMWNEESPTVCLIYLIRRQWILLSNVDLANHNFALKYQRSEIARKDPLSLKYSCFVICFSTMLQSSKICVQTFTFFSLFILVVWALVTWIL